jgi:AcrR family transcriptional regulator
MGPFVMNLTRLSRQFIDPALWSRTEGFYLNNRSDSIAIMARTTGSHSDITGPRIRETAMRLFARHGFAAVSMRRIAGEVGVQAGALYNYMPDKQSLLFGLMQGHMQELLQAQAEREAPQDVIARLEDFTRFHIRFHLERPDAVFISYMELRNLTPDNFAVIEGLRRSYEDTLESILRDGAASGALEVPDTKIATLAVIAMLNGVNTWYRAGGRLTPNEIEMIYWDMVRKAMLPNGLA